MDVLIVDDNQEIADVLKGYFEKKRISSEACYSYCAALDKNPMDYKIILSDLHLDNNTLGSDLIDIFKKSNSRIRTIIYTAQSSTVDCEADFVYRKGYWTIEHLVGLIEGISNNGGDGSSENRKINIIIRDVAILQAAVEKNKSDITRLETSSEIFGNTINFIREEVTEIKGDVKSFIDKHTYDWIKIVGAIGILLGLAMTILQLSGKK